MNDRPHLAEKKMNERDFKVYSPISNLLIGAGDAIACIILMVVALWPHEGGAVSPIILTILIVFFVLGLYFIYAYFREVVTVKGDIIYYRGLAGPTKEMAVKEVSHAKTRRLSRKVKALTVYSKEDRAFVVNSNCPGYRFLVKRLEDAKVSFE